MKKAFLILCAAFVAMGVYAQDIIVTRNSQRIEAKILEVSSAEIKYKEFNNQDGPTFVLTAAEINTIIYQNGTVKVFDQPVAQPVQQQYAPVYAAQPAQAQPAQNAYGHLAGLPITKSDDNYFIGDQRLNEEQYLAFIQANCAEAWESYQKGKGLWKSGWTCFGVGLGFEAVGAMFYGLGVGLSGGRTSSSVYLGMGIPGIILLSSGSALLVASVPCLIVGGIKKNTSHNVYNERCAKQQMAVTFGLQASQNGFGLAMKF